MYYSQTLHLFTADALLLWYVEIQRIEVNGVSRLFIYTKVCRKLSEYSLACSIFGTVIPNIVLFIP